MTTLIVGNALDGASSAQGLISYAEIADGVNHTDAQRIRRFTRATPSKMSQINTLYWEGATNPFYHRPSLNPDFGMAAENDFGSQIQEQTEQALQIAVYQKGTGANSNSVFYLDNVQLSVSTILWEVSADGETYYPLVDAINEPLTRFVFPAPTTTLRVRVTGFSNNDWVKSYVIKPCQSGSLPL